MGPRYPPLQQVGSFLLISFFPLHFLLNCIITYLIIQTFVSAGIRPLHVIAFMFDKLHCMCLLLPLYLIKYIDLKKVMFHDKTLVLLLPQFITCRRFSPFILFHPLSCFLITQNCVGIHTCRYSCAWALFT